MDAVLKTAVIARLPWVRIPPLPTFFSKATSFLHEGLVTILRFLFALLFSFSFIFESLPGQELRLIDATHRAFDPVLAPPSIVSAPQPIFDVKHFGAVGDGVTFDTAAIQKAIDSCAGTGGTVYLSGGKFLTAPLELKGKMTFYINADASLLGSTRPEDYPDKIPPQTEALANRKSLIYAFAADGLIMDGGGEINGQGQQLTWEARNLFAPPSSGFLAAKT
jgi:hypothetical protein